MRIWQQTWDSVGIEPLQVRICQQTWDLMVIEPLKVRIWAANVSFAIPTESHVCRPDSHLERLNSHRYHTFCCPDSHLEGLNSHRIPRLLRGIPLGATQFPWNIRFSLEVLDFNSLGQPEYLTWRGSSPPPPRSNRNLS